MGSLAAMVECPSPRASPRYKSGTCTHLTMTCLYTKDFGCCICGRHGDLGWLWRCTQDRELLIDDDFEQGCVAEEGNIFERLPEPVWPRKRSPQIRNAEPNAFLSECSEEELQHYSPQELNQILMQREKLFETLKCHEIFRNLGISQNDGAKATGNRNVQASSQSKFSSPVVTPAQSDADRKKPAWLPDNECQFKCCQACRRNCPERAYLSLNAVADGEYQPTAVTGFGFHLLGKRPVSLVKFVKNLGLRAPAALIQRYSDDDTDTYFGPGMSSEEYTRAWNRKPSKLTKKKSRFGKGYAPREAKKGLKFKRRDPSRSPKKNSNTSNGSDDAVRNAVRKDLSDGTPDMPDEVLTAINSAMGNLMSTPKKSNSGVEVRAVNPGLGYDASDIKDAFKTANKAMRSFVRPKEKGESKDKIETKENGPVRTENQHIVSNRLRSNAITSGSDGTFWEVRAPWSPPPTPQAYDAKVVDQLDWSTFDPAEAGVRSGRNDNSLRIDQVLSPLGCTPTDGDRSLSPLASTLADEIENDGLLFPLIPRPENLLAHASAIPLPTMTKAEYYNLQFPMALPEYLPADHRSMEPWNDEDNEFEHHFGRRPVHVGRGLALTEEAVETPFADLMTQA